VRPRYSKERIRKQLDHEIASSEFASCYQAIQEAAPQLKRFSRPSDLLRVLWDAEDKDYAAKDACLHALISVFHTRPEVKAACFQLLLLAMWPALEHLYYRLLPINDWAEDFFSEIYWAFLAEIEGWNLRKVDKVAANLVLNTRKRVFAAAGVEEGRRGDPKDSPPPLRSGRNPRWEPLAPPRRPRLASALQGLIARGVIREDDCLFIVRHAVYEIPLRTLAQEQGRSYAAVRKRFFRLIVKLREHLDVPDPGFPGI
jgi:hypothetical protein